MKARYCPCRGVKPGRSSGQVVSISSPRCAGDAMNIRFRVELSEAERDALTAMLSGGRQAARKLKRTQILLAADAGSSDEVIAACVGSPDDLRKIVRQGGNDDVSEVCTTSVCA